MNLKYLFICLLLSVGLVSCDDDENDALVGLVTYEILKPNTSISQPEEVWMEFTDYFIVDVTYKTPCGQLKILNDVNLPWKETFKVGAPFVASLQVSYRLRENKTLMNQVCVPYGNISSVTVEAGGVTLTPKGIYVAQGSWSILSKSVTEWLNENGKYNYSVNFTEEEIAKNKLP